VLDEVVADSKEDNLKWTDSLGNRLIVWMERRPSLEQFLIC